MWSLWPVPTPCHQVTRRVGKYDLVDSSSRAPLSALLSLSLPLPLSSLPDPTGLLADGRPPEQAVRWLLISLYLLRRCLYWPVIRTPFFTTFRCLPFTEGCLKPSPRFVVLLGLSWHLGLNSMLVNTPPLYISPRKPSLSHAGSV